MNIAAHRVYQSTLTAPHCSTLHFRGRCSVIPASPATPFNPGSGRRPGPRLEIRSHTASVDGRYSVIGHLSVICCTAASAAQKKAQPRRVALKFHQRRRFWRICADVCKDTQHGSHFATTLRPVKRFLLLRNINFIVERVRISKLKRSFAVCP